MGMGQFVCASLIAREVSTFRNPLMPQPSDVPQPRPSAEDSFLDLLTETLEGLDDSARGLFLRQFFRTTAQIDLTEGQSNEYWEQILHRRLELGQAVGKRVSLKTAMVDVLASANFLRVPILMEYDEFKKLQINAATDALTGLYNRRLFDEYCDKELTRARRYGHHLAVVILDLRKLKEVNDRHGHLHGDQVLQLASSTLRKTLRASDFAFRIGGDEFALLLPQTDPEQALTICRRLRAQYESEVQPLRLGIGVTLDFGIAVYPQDGDQKSELMGLADKKLYELKQSGIPPLRTIPIEQPPPSSPAAAAPTSKPFSSEVAAAQPQPSSAVAAAVPRPRAEAEQRKWERVSLAGTKAHAVLTDFGQKRARVIDLSYGGVALLLERADEIPNNQFNAVLHVPILPPVRVILRRIYTLRNEEGRVRLGCSFVS